MFISFNSTSSVNESRIPGQYQFEKMKLARLGNFKSRGSFNPLFKLYGLPVTMAKGNDIAGFISWSLNCLFSAQEKGVFRITGEIRGREQEGYGLMKVLRRG